MTARRVVGRFRLLAPLVCAACGLPRDPDGTLDRVRGGTLRVGVVPNPPWVTDSLGALGGVEVRLVEELARGLGARIAWVRRPQDAMLEALRARELDLLVGGLTDDATWKTEVAHTKPFYTDTVAVGSAQGVPVRDLTSRVVAVERGDAASAELRKRGARPLVVDDLSRAPGAIVAPTWRIAALGRVNSGIVFKQSRHVMAAAPGENAWLVHVERFLHARESRVGSMLRGAAQGAAR
jgi:polar amino acid transport system substrate-binding protein